MQVIKRGYFQSKLCNKNIKTFWTSHKTKMTSCISIKNRRKYAYLNSDPVKPLTYFCFFFEWEQTWICMVCTYFEKVDIANYYLWFVSHAPRIELQFTCYMEWYKFMLPLMVANRKHLQLFIQTPPQYRRWKLGQ